MKKLAILLSLFAATLSAQTPEQRLATMATQIDGVTGVAAVHVESGRRLALNGDERFPMASVYKIPIAIVTLQNTDARWYSLDEQVLITPGQYAPGHSPLRDETKGQRAFVPTRRLLRMMISLSDNTASDLLLGFAGGSRKVTLQLKAPGIRVDRTETELARDLDADAVAFGNDVRDTATPNAMADLLVRLWKNDVGLSKTSNDLLLQFMRETSTGPNRIRAGVPAGVKVADKTGTWTFGANDVGILESPDGKQHVAIAIFTKNGKATTEEREKVIAAVAGAVWRELTR